MLSVGQMASAWKGTKTSFPGALSECLDAAKSYCADSHSPALEILQPHKLGALLGAIKTDISSHGAYGWTHTFNTFPNLFELLSTLSKSRFVTLTPSTLSVLIECISSVIQELPADSTLDAEKTDGLRFMQQR